MHPGSIVAGKYRVARVLGRKNGYLLEAYHTDFEQRVVIRLLLPSMCDQKELTRFRREARTLSKLESEHATRIIDVGTHSDGSFYLVRQYLDGKDLGAYLKERGGLPLEDAVLYVLQACDAVQEAHSHKIVLRELQPQHLFLTSRRGGSQLIKIVDFGTAKVLKDAAPAEDGDHEATAIFGISPYGSPELIRGTDKVDLRTDVWSLGCILYELLAAVKPFQGDTAELMLKITREPPVPLSRLRPDIPKEFDQLIDWALAKDRASRFNSVYALAHALKPYASTEGQLLIERIGRLAQVDQKTEKQTPAISPTSPLTKGAERLTSSSSDQTDMERTQFFGSGPGSTAERGSQPGPAPRQSQTPGFVLESSAALSVPGSTGGYPAQSQRGKQLRARQRRMATVAIAVAVVLMPALGLLLVFVLRSQPAETVAMVDDDGGSKTTSGDRPKESAGDGKESTDGEGAGGATGGAPTIASAEPSASAEPATAAGAKPPPVGGAATAPATGPKNGTIGGESTPPPPPPPPPPLPPPPPPPPTSSGGKGKLVAIAVGGSCAFAVDGAAKGTKSSIRMVVPVGAHTVSCTPSGKGATRSQRVTVKDDKPGMAVFKLN